MPFETYYSTEAFCAAFVSALVISGIRSIHPHSDAARCGFQAVMDKLDEEIGIAKQHDDRDGVHNLLMLRTDLAPSSNGGFDSFESCLRSLQTTVSSPNSAFVDLKFDVSRSYAESSLSFLSADWGDLARSAARLFNASAMFNASAKMLHDEKRRLSIA